jgi:cation diffusion facilitator family transporter
MGAHLARKPADRRHPYGHARIEYLTNLVVSVIILIVGYELLKNSVMKVLHPVETTFSWAMVGFMVFAILLKGSSALFTIATGQRIQSLPVIGAGTDNRNDVITSIIILCGMLLHHYTGLELDGYIGCLVSLFILWSGISLIQETVDQLLGAEPDPKLVKNVEEIILSHEGVLGIHDLVLYSYGPGRTYAMFDAEVDGRASAMEIHEIIDHIEHEIMEKLQIRVSCHMDPILPDDPERLRLMEELAEALQGVDGVEGIHDLHVIQGEDGKLLHADVVIAPGTVYSPEKITEEVNQALTEAGENCQAVLFFDQAYTVTKNKEVN